MVERRSKRHPAKFNLMPLHMATYERAPHVTLRAIANNAEIDVIWENFQTTLGPLRAQINKALGETWEEWETPRDSDKSWSDAAKKAHAAWWEARIERQKKIDASIAKAADVEFLYDRPFEDKSRVRVAGPFTVESLSPHRVVPADVDEQADTLKASQGKRSRSKFVTPPTDFAEMVLEHLRTAGVHQAEKRDTIQLTSLAGWLDCIPDLLPGVRSESGYFRSLVGRCGDGTEGKVDGGDHRVLA
ncbi:MAG: hypothetical protein AB7O44_04295, partial [Hyphomicrobiaceae bacterium]